MSLCGSAIGRRMLQILFIFVLSHTISPVHSLEAIDEPSKDPSKDIDLQLLARADSPGNATGIVLNDKPSDSDKKLDWDRAVSKGNNLIDLLATEGLPSCGVEESNFTSLKALEENGWDKLSKGPPKIGTGWNVAASMLRLKIGDPKNTQYDVGQFSNVTIKGKSYRKSSGVYSNVMNTDGAIFALQGFSPRSRGAYLDPPLDGSSGREIVPLQSWADIAFIEWSDACKGDEACIRGLKMVIKCHSLSNTTDRIATEALGGKDGWGTWPGKTFKNGSKELAATLATPSGRGVAWLLLTHRKQLGWKYVDSVDVWSEKEHDSKHSFFVFHIEDQAESKLPTPRESNTGSGVVARSGKLIARDNEWDKAVAKGKQYLSILKCGSAATSEFKDYKSLADWGWEATFSDHPKGPFPDVNIKAMEYVGANFVEKEMWQEWDEHNTETVHDGTKYLPTKAIYENQYSPEFIISQNNWGPRNTGPEQDDPVDDIFPKLERMSDILFLEFQRLMISMEKPLTGLRGFLRENVVNHESQNLAMKALGVETGLFGFAPSDLDRVKDWPGTDFDADSDELAALVASPNGRGPFWLLATHKEQLGHKTISSVRVYARDRILFMLFKFEDVDESPDAADGGASMNDRRDSGEQRAQKTSKQTVPRGDGDPPPIPVPQPPKDSNDFMSDEKWNPWVEKGKAYLELLNCGKGTESKWKSYDDLKKYGWVRRSESHPLKIYPKGGLANAINYLGVSSKDEDQWQVADHHLEETTVDGKTYYPTNARYNNKYNMELITSDFNFGPRNKGQFASPPVTGDPNPYPPLEHYSDVVYLEFVRLMKLNNKPIDKLKGVLRSHVVNPEAREIVEKAVGMLKDNMMQGKLPWPGKDFDANSDELAALIASPNGRGVAWLLATHKELGRKTISNARVYYDNGIFILFVFKDLDEDTGDQDPSTKATRDLATRSTEFSIKPRAISNEDYEKYLEKGKKLVAALQSTEDCFEQSIFTEYKALDEWGWSVRMDNRGAEKFGPYLNVFKSVKASWDWDKNRKVMDVHDQKREKDGKTYFPTRASYNNRYNPALIICSNNFGPANKGKTVLPLVTGDPNPFPLLARQSDILFLEYQRVMKEISENQPLDQLKAVWRYGIVNDDTRNLCIKFAVPEGGYAINHIPKWPGKDFAAGSDELAALVASPNGRAVAYLLLQHREQMGRKQIRKVKVWYDFMLHVLFYIGNDDAESDVDSDASSPSRRDSAYADSLQDLSHSAKAKNVAPRALDQADFDKFVKNGRPLVAALQSFDECLAQSEWTKDDSLATWGWSRTRKPKVGPVSFFNATAQVYEFVGASMEQDSNHRAIDSHSVDKEIDGVKYYKTGAEFDNRYNPAMIVADNIYGVEHEGKDQKPPVTGDSNPYPKLRFWSDVTFLEYQNFMHDTAESLDQLKAICHRFIINTKTRDLAARIFDVDDWTDVGDWPGKDFSPGSDEFSALIGSENGKGTVFLLLQHRKQLGAKTITKVRVWKDHDLHILYLFDDTCAGGDDGSAAHESRLVRRIDEQDSESLKRARDDGRFLLMAQDSTVDILKNCLDIEQSHFSELKDLERSGWTELQNTQEDVKEEKDLATFNSWLDLNLDLSAKSNHKIEYQHLKKTTGSDGRVYYPSGAYYRSLFSEGAIAALDSKSPWSAGKDRKPRVDGVTNAFPPLKQWSDEAFLVYKDICKDDPAKMAKLKGVLRHGISNDKARKVLLEYLGKKNELHEGIPKEWPGTLYKLDDDGFQVALGVPNGKGVAYLLATNREALGWKEIYQIRIFSASWASAYNILYYIREHKDASQRRSHIDAPMQASPHEAILLHNRNKSIPANDGTPATAYGIAENRALLHLPRASADDNYESALEKGADLLCKAHSDTADQSVFTSFEALKKYGWDERAGSPEFIDAEDIEIGQLYDLFQGLHLPMGERDNIAHGFKHSRDSEVDDHFYPYTSAKYELMLNVAGGALIADSSNSPIHQPKASNMQSGEELVALRQWSDVAFLVWQHDSGDKIKELKFVVQSIINNPVSVRVIGHVLEKRKETAKEWPGLKIPMSDPDAQALLGTPNGGGVAWLLIQHKEQLGLKVPSAVTIYGRGSTTQSLCFWIADKTDSDVEMHEASKDKRTFNDGSTLATSIDVVAGRSTQLRSRADNDLYHSSEERGLTLLCMAHNFDFHHNEQSAWTRFESIAEYGWYEPTGRQQTQEELTSLDILEPFKDLKLPLGESDNVARSFKHEEDSHVGEHNYPSTTASYGFIFNVEGGAIAVTNSFGPASRLKASNLEPGEELVPLRQWSDLSFLAWQHYSGDKIKNLNYVFRDMIINDEAVKVITRILKSRGEQLKPWPGLKISMKEPDAQALLGSPNGRGVAWLLIQHKEQLGVKVPDAVTVYGDLRGPTYNLCFWISDKTNLDFELDDPGVWKRATNTSISAGSLRTVSASQPLEKAFTDTTNWCASRDAPVSWSRRLEKRLSGAIKAVWTSLWLV